MLHPLVRWISRQIHLEREIACDGPEEKGTRLKPRVPLYYLVGGGVGGASGGCGPTTAVRAV